MVWIQHTMTADQLFRWGLGALPRIDRAGNWPLDDRGFEHAYLSLTHALHVYDYAAAVRIGGQAIAIRPGDATITPAGIASRYHLDRPGRHWCVHFHPIDPGAAAVGIPLHLRLGAMRRHVVDAVRRIAGLLSTPPGGQRVAAEAGASAMLLEVLLELSAWPRAGGTRTGAEAALLQAATLIDERLSDRLDVPALARQAGLTQNYLARRFRLHFGCTLHGYQLARRIEHAQQLLETTDMPIARIAERLGFSDAQHFNKQFRRLLSACPTSFRAGRHAHRAPGPGAGTGGPPPAPGEAGTGPRPGRPP
jgi:AraC-like DNA-binding protein